MKDCIFCKIINNELPSKTLYEDETIKVIMNINPNTNGHLLVLPKKHVVNLMDTDNETINHMLNIVREKLYPMLKEKIKCEGLTLAQNNELGQEIKHYHLHLIPRYQNDNADFNYNKDILKDIEEIYNELTK
ncbi:MAG: HIT domain-containing protein [Bacilli bacterium]|nr:HIT domain-containing protein [Bacilli bacterium]